MISYSNDEECIIFSKDESLDSDLLMAEEPDQDSTEPAQSVENGEFIKLLDELIQPSWIHSSLFPHPPTLHAADLPPPEPPPEPPPWCSLWTNFGEMSFIFILFANLSIAISLLMGSMGSPICCDYLKCLQTESRISAEHHRASAQAPMESCSFTEFRKTQFYLAQKHSCIDWNSYQEITFNDNRHYCRLSLC